MNEYGRRIIKSEVYVERTTLKVIPTDKLCDYKINEIYVVDNEIDSEDLDMAKNAVCIYHNDTKYNDLYTLLRNMSIEAKTVGLII